MDATPVNRNRADNVNTDAVDPLQNSNMNDFVNGQPETSTPMSSSSESEPDERGDETEPDITQSQVETNFSPNSSSSYLGLPGFNSGVTEEEQVRNRELFLNLPKVPPDNLWIRFMQDFCDLRQEMRQGNQKIQQGQAKSEERQEALDKNIQVLNQKIQQGQEKSDKNIQALNQKIDRGQQEINNRLDAVNTRIDKVDERLDKIKQDVDNRFKDFSKEVDSKIAESAQEVKTRLADTINSKFNQLKDEQQIHETQVKSIVDMQEKMNKAQEELTVAVTSLKSDTDDLPDRMDSLSRELGFLKLSQEKTIKDVQHLNKLAEIGAFDSDTTLAQKCIAEHRTYITEVEELIKERENDLVSKLTGNIKEVEKRLRTEIAGSRGNNNADNHGPAYTRNMTQNLTRVDNENYSRPLSHEEGVYPPHTCHSNSPVREHFNTVPKMGDATQYLVTVMEEESLLKHRQFPIFTPGNKNAHPVLFIRSFYDVFPSSWTDKRRIQFVIGYMQGEALLWGTDMGTRCRTYAEFEHEFLAKYWSRAVQERIRHQAFNPPPYNRKRGGLRNYFEKCLNMTKYFTIPVTQSDLLNALRDKLPGDIARDLALVSSDDIDQFLKILDSLELAYDRHPQLSGSLWNRDNFHMNNNPPFFNSQFNALPPDQNQYNINANNHPNNFNNPGQPPNNGSPFNGNNFNNNYNNASNSNTNYGNNGNYRNGNRRSRNRYGNWGNGINGGNFNNTFGWHPYRQQQNFNSQGQNFYNSNGHNDFGRSKSRGNNRNFQQGRQFNNNGFHNQSQNFQSGGISNTNPPQNFNANSPNQQQNFSPSNDGKWQSTRPAAQLVEVTDESSQTNNMNTGQQQGNTNGSA